MITWLSVYREIRKKEGSLQTGKVRHFFHRRVRLEFGPYYSTGSLGLPEVLNNHQKFLNRQQKVEELFCIESQEQEIPVPVSGITQSLRLVRKDTVRGLRVEKIGLIAAVSFSSWANTGWMTHRKCCFSWTCILSNVKGWYLYLKFSDVRFK